MKTKLFIIGLLFIPLFTYASTEVGLVPSTSNIQEGSSFTVDLKISVSKTPINTIDGIIVYDASKLEVKDVNTDGSMLSIWPKPANFDNTKGEVSFVGGTNKGFVGENSQVLKITFLAKKSGQAKIDFRDSFAVYQDDGKGTLINPWLQPTEVNISAFTGGFPWKIISLILLVLVIVFIAKRYVKSK